MPCRVIVLTWVLVEGFDLFLIDGDGKYLFFLELIRMGLISFNNHQSIIFMEFNLTWGKEYFGEEVLF